MSKPDYDLLPVPPRDDPTEHGDAELPDGDITQLETELPDQPDTDIAPDHDDLGGGDDGEPDENQRQRARSMAAEAALLGYRHKSKIHYTQGSQRWEGIDTEDIAHQGEYPTYADCSAFATWCLWNGLYVALNKPDVVNGCHWRAGYTGSMMEHGTVIRKVSEMRKGDCVFYAKSGYKPTHVAIMVGRKNKVPMVVSHGSEPGPYYLQFDYRRIVCVRRYIRKGV